LGRYPIRRSEKEPPDLYIGRLLTPRTGTETDGRSLAANAITKGENWTKFVSPPAWRGPLIVPRPHQGPVLHDINVFHFTHLHQYVNPFLPMVQSDYTKGHKVAKNLVSNVVFLVQFWCNENQKMGLNEVTKGHKRKRLELLFLALELDIC